MKNREKKKNIFIMKNLIESPPEEGSGRRKKELFP